MFRCSQYRCEVWVGTQNGEDRIWSSRENGQCYFYEIDVICNICMYVRDVTELQRKYQMGQSENLSQHRGAPEVHSRGGVGRGGGRRRNIHIFCDRGV